MPSRALIVAENNEKENKFLVEGRECRLYIPSRRHDVLLCVCVCKIPSDFLFPVFPSCYSKGDILEDIELIENLEQTKKTAIEIEEKVKLAKQTEINIAKVGMLV